jgi:hypothetical protein
MIALTVVSDRDARAEAVARCPICNASARDSASEITNYLCGARVTAAPHGSWSLSIPCQAATPA